MARLCGTYESYAGIRRKIVCKHKIFDVLAVLRRISACFSVFVTYTELTHNLLDVRQRFCQICHTLGIRCLNRQGVTAKLQPFLQTPTPDRRRYAVTRYV